MDTWYQRVEGFCVSGHDSRIREWRDSVYLELSGITKEPLTMAKGCSPNGVVKKHNLYSRHPRACSG